MSDLLSLILSATTEGLIYVILAFGVMLSYKILDFADLSVDGTFPLGGAISAILIVNGINPWIAIIISFLGGVFAGLITGWLHVKLRIAGLLSGILVMTALYSINLRVAGGTSNIPLYNYNTIITSPFAGTEFGSSGIGLFINENYTLILLLIMVVVLKISLDWLLRTRFGYLLKVTGDNEGLVAVLGHDSSKIKMIGLGISNGLAALSGAVLVSVRGYYDINAGRGMVVLGLASVILGTVLLKKTKTRLTGMVILGAIVYRMIVAVAIRLGLDSKDLQLITVIIFIIAISMNNMDLRKYISRGGTKDA